MAESSPVFERHYENYIRQLAALDLAVIGRDLGGTVTRDPRGTTVCLTYFGREYHVSAKAILRPDNTRAGYDTCIVLSRHLIMGGETNSGPQNISGRPRTTWLGFRDLKESGPLTVYFKDNVEIPLTAILSGRAGDAGAVASALRGHVPDTDLNYDLVLEIPCLPKIPVRLLFNDADEDFPGSCSILFRHDVETLLDAECIAMTGYRLAAEIRKILG